MKKNSGKAPSIQFYYKDWLADERLKMCSLKAKGLWIEIICQSVSLPIPGVFAFKNESKSDQNKSVFEPISEQKLLQMFTGKPSEKRKAFDELKRYGVIKQEVDKAFYVKRVKEDMELRTIRKEAGKKGGNPQLTGKKVGDLDNQKGKQKPTPSSSSSSSSKKENNTKEKISFSLEAACFVNILPEDIQRWSEAYPAVDVDLAIKQAAQWLVSNPTKLKKNYQRFLTNWFSRTQERGGNRNGRTTETRGRPAKNYIR